MAPLVTFISGSYQPDRCGVADYTRRLAQSLLAEQVGVLIVTARSALSFERATSPQVIALTSDWKLSSLADLLRGIRRLKPDIIHIQHSASSFGQSHAFGLFPLLLNVVRPRLPVITTAHEYGGWPVRLPLVPTSIINATGSWLERRGLADREDLFLLSMSQAVIVTNQYHFDYVGQRVPGVKHKLRLVPIGPNIVEIAAGQESVRNGALAGLGLPSSVRLITYFGFIHPVKGLEQLLKAFQQLSQGSANLHLAIIGGVQNLSLTPEEAQRYYEGLLRLRDELGLRRSVTFTGYIDAERVSQLLLASELCVLPFNHGASLKSGSLLAAMAHGLPVLTTRTEATTEDLRDGENLLLIPPRDQTALIRGLQRLLDSEELRAHLHEGALALAKRFSWQRIASEHIELYNRVLGRT